MQNKKGGTKNPWIKPSRVRNPVAKALRNSPMNYRSKVVQHHQGVPEVCPECHGTSPTWPEGMECGICANEGEIWD